ncbi:RHS repeat domain-containing protein [Cellulomonas denverensis]|uniref:RHS repeat domain-containing protein n=1 Tax=Cellulomonas denverensis TaxID=264297 RepID=UPI0035E4BBAD
MSTYVRGGYLNRIEYGQRAGSESASQAPARVEFTVAERCLPSGGITCDPAQLTEANAKSWPDVPFDLMCTSTTSCPEQTSPSFFTRKRLTSVKTRVLVGSSYQDVDAWNLRHTFPDTGDRTNSALWLDGITHQGLVGSTITLPEVTFRGEQMANRVDTTGDASPPMNRYRVTAISSEAGGTTTINYSAPDCTSGSLPAAADSNSRRCFPVSWQPEGTGPEIQEYFHKYVVNTVVENPNDEVSAAVETAYHYVGDPAWHYDDSPFTAPAHRTWSEFRGYAAVDVITGSAMEQRSQVRTRYFRGMDGDRLASGGTRQVTVDGIADTERLNGFVREEITYNGIDGPEIGGTVTTPWISAATAVGADGTRAAFLRPGTVEERTVAPALPGGVRTTRSVTSYETAYGLPTQIDDQGDVSTAADDRCIRTEYAQNPAASIISTAKRVETVSVNCATAPSRPRDVISDERTFYDGGAFGAAPTRGLPTTSQVVSAYSGTTPTYVTTSTTTYDSLGRPTVATDAMGRASTTAYTGTGGVVTGTTVTAPDPDGSGPITAGVTTAVLNPAWGSMVKTTDPNGKVTSATFDALGRTTAVWNPGRAQGSASAHTTYEYTISKTAPNTVTTKTLAADETYLTSVALYDGMLRPRQTQSPSAARDTPGRIITDTFYDSRGNVAWSNGSWFAAGAVSTSLVVPTTAVPSRTRYLYDGAGRSTATITDVGEQERWRTTTSYGGDRVTVDPPQGGTAQTTISDARGNTTELRQYLGGHPTGDFRAVSYGYDRAGNLTSVKDAAGNAWSYTYDLRGRQVTATDPDKGATTTTYDEAGRPRPHHDGCTGGHALHRARPARSPDRAPRRHRHRDPAGQVDLRHPAEGTAHLVDPVLRHGGLRHRGHRLRRRRAATRRVGHAAQRRRHLGWDLHHQLHLHGRRPGQVHEAAGRRWTRRRDRHYPLRLPVPPRMDVGRSRVGGVYVADTVYDVYGEPLRYDLGNTYAFFLNYSYEEGTRRLQKTWVEREGVGGLDMDLTYTYDASGNPTSVVDNPTDRPADAQCFAYDGLRQLTSAWTPASSDCSAPKSVTELGGPAPYWTDYAIDAAGNRSSETTHTAAGDTTRTYAYPATGAARPHAVSTVKQTGAAGAATSSYAYDATGNTTTRNVGGKAGQTLKWDAEGRLESIAQGTSTVMQALYTADGERLIRRENGVVTLYLPGGQELALTTATKAVKATRYYGFNGQTLAMRTGTAGSTVSSLISDPHQTASMAIANTTKVITQRRTDPYGNTRGTAAAWPGDHGFMNKVQDASGLTQVGARYYDALIGRFVSVDPVFDQSAPQSWGSYSYADNNPVTYWDPTGMWSWKNAWNKVRRGVSAAAHGAVNLVRRYQAEIVGVVVGGVVTAGCLAVTSGTGSVGCFALGGAAGGAATNLWRSRVQKTQPFSWRSLARDTAIGGLVGAIAGPASGAVRSATSAVVSRVAPAVAARIAAQRAASTVVTGQLSRATLNAGARSGAASGAASGVADASMDSMTAAGATVRHSSTATAIGDDSSTVVNFGRSQGAGGRHDVIVHGTSEGRPLVNGNVTNTQQIADAVLENPNYRPGCAITLVMCHGGREAASELSRILDVDVVATTRKAQLSPIDGGLMQGSF